MSFTRMIAIAALTAGAMLPALGAHSQTLTTLYSFKGLPDGRNPQSGLLYRGGSLYGTTYGGGVYGAGTAFKIIPSTGAETVIYSFRNGYPTSSLTGPGKNIYGETYGGGSHKLGSVFRINTATGTQDLLYSFTDRADGRFPTGGLVYEGGVLYGTAVGGAFSQGTLFKVIPSTGAFTVLHSFGSGTDGSSPNGGLVYQGGVLYGTTYQGGASNGGTVFKVDPNTGAETVLHSFSFKPHGLRPNCGLIYGDGVLYGTTDYGGTSNNGTLFKVNPSTGAETVVYNFTTAIGASPVNKLLYQAGALYGVLTNGGASGYGSLFKVIAATGAPTLLYSFTDGADGGYPVGELIYHSGIFYGTTLDGGANGSGTVFTLTP